MKIKINGEETKVKENGTQLYSQDEMVKFKRAVMITCGVTMSFLIVGKSALNLLQQVSSTFLYGMNVDVGREMFNGVILLFTQGGLPLLLVLGMAGYGVYKNLRGDK